MEYSKNLSHFFSHEITIIQTNLLPINFNESTEKMRLCVAVVSDILNSMGRASATAQNLQTPVTSSVKFSHSDQVIYLMTSLSENNIIGFLKMGWKNLFLFDNRGSYIKERCFCCLDFYIHETKQRQGYGKKLYDFMLQDNAISASSIPVDRPSEKFLKFLFKHYNLRTIIPQANNFILYEEFFSARESSDNERMKIFPSTDSKLKTVNQGSSCKQVEMENCVRQPWSR